MVSFEDGLQGLQGLHTFAKRADSGTPSSSISGLVSTLIPSLVYFGIFVGIFMILRSSHRRIYAPRTYIGVLDEEERTPPLPKGFLKWIPALFKVPDTYVLHHHSLDAYLLLRFLRVSTTICFVGCLMTWPVLFPVNATGGGGQKQLNLLALGNVANNYNRYYAHTFIAWIFVSFVFYTITREMIYFINLRQAYFLSPSYASRISSRTVLFSTVPEDYLNETKIRRMFGNEKVKNVFIATDTKKLEEKVEERDKAAFKLEAAETKLIRTANAARIKAGHHVDEEAPQPGNTVEDERNGESGSVASRWIKTKDRPTHKLKPLIGKKVDTINWSRSELQRLNPEIEALQARHRAGDAKKVSSVFVEFYAQADAQAAYQMLAYHQPLHMSPRYIGLHPSEIIWSNLRIKWWERVIRYAATVGFVCVMVIFWSIPVAAVGAMSNLYALTDKVHFLRFILKLPSVLLGVITGLLPSILMAVLMALVPIVLRLMAKLGGAPTTSAVELRTQNFYFTFQMVEVFLVTTLASAASTTVTKIIDDPTSAPSLLANNIPGSSNFYISYFILQGLAFSAGTLLQVAALVISKFIGILDNTPRKIYSRFSSLAGLGWGTVLPTLSMLTAIAITYSCIAPLVLGFATIGLWLFYFAFRYNLLFVTNANIDTKGMIYPRALQHITVGCYLLIVCLIGLFAISIGASTAATGPMILMIIFLVFTILFHVSLNSAMQPLFDYLPKSLEAEEEALLALEQGEAPEASKPHNGASAAHEGPVLDNENGDKALETSGSAAPQKKPNLLAKFLRPDKYSDYATLRRLVPSDLPEISYPPEIESSAYFHPSITSQPPLLWVPRDMGGVSQQEVMHSSKVIPITDEGASLNEKSKIVWNEESRPPIYEQKIIY